LNGGLSDYMFTFETFIDMVNRIQNVNLLAEMNDLIFFCINLQDMNTNLSVEHVKIYIPSLNERSKITFNEDILCVCIKTGWLNKYLSESVKHAPTFFNLLLTNFCTNKILTAIYLYLRLLNEQVGEDVGNNEERNAMNVIIPVLVEVYSDHRRCPITLVLAAKCLCAIVCKDTDKRNRIILMQEDIVPKLAVYLDHYDFDDKLLIVSLELFAYVIPELKAKINEYLSDIHGLNILNNFKQILNKTKAPGTYYSQRVLTKVITIILTMTNILEAGVKEKLNSPSEIRFYDSLLTLIDDDKKDQVLDPIEETSYILEFKVFWLLCILVFKNEKAKEYLFTKFELRDFIEKKSQSFYELISKVIEGVKSKQGYSDQMVETIVKNVSKFFEFTYYLMIKDNEKILLMRGLKEYNKLLKLIDTNRPELGIGKEFDVFNWINRLYRDLQELENF